MGQSIRVKSDLEENGIELGPSELLSRIQEHGGHAGGNEYSARQLHEAFFGTQLAPTSFEVCGGDRFFAHIPWGSADDAVFRFPGSGAEGERAGGVRFEMRGSSNACLNVKAIAEIHFRFDDDLAAPVFGSKLPGNPKVCKNQQ